MKKLPIHILAFAALFSLASCRADLQVQKHTGADDETAYCHIDESTGLLIVTIVNKGRATAPESTTLVQFEPGKKVNVPTPAIAPGESVRLQGVHFEYQDHCSNPDCHFTITADAKNAVKEWREGNNEVTGHCPVAPVSEEKEETNPLSAN
ncbi:MAG: hypothetical protein KDC66_05250 [Phaeodactylibacter sp.]|nr:hypothetical protein [Phaeodactylibacter sp.]MCB9272942.1 hypothetical protein [Lewinellaceae bacterium]